jgi:DNA-binding response OmpR family regulator
MASDVLTLAQATHTDARRRSPRIAICDDEAQMRSLFAKALRGWFVDPSIVEFDDGDVLLQDIHRVQPDLLMTDLNHLGCNHITMLEVLAERRVGFPILVISGKGSGYITELQRLTALLNLSWIHKPCLRRELHDRISNLLPQFPVQPHGALKK